MILATPYYEVDLPVEEVVIPKTKRFNEATISRMFLDWLYTAVSGGVENPYTTDALTQTVVVDKIKNNVGENFSGFCSWVGDAIQNAASRAGGILGGFVKIVNAIINKAVEWLSKISAESGASASSALNSVAFGGTTYGTLLAWGIVSALIIIAGKKFFKALFKKGGSDNNEDDDKHYSSQDDARLRSTISQGLRDSTDYKAILDDSTKELNEIFEITDAELDHVMLNEGIFDMFSWFGRIVRRAYENVREIVVDVKDYMQRHPVLACLILVCCFFVLLCMPYKDKLGQMAKLFGVK